MPAPGKPACIPDNAPYAPDTAPPMNHTPVPEYPGPTLASSVTKLQLPTKSWMSSYFRLLNRFLWIRVPLLGDFSKAMSR